MILGVHPKVVQERLGHATISTTLDLYSHVTPGLQEAVAADFGKIMIPIMKKLWLKTQLVSILLAKMKIALCRGCHKALI